MLGYYTRLAFKSFRHTPGLTLLMTAAIALGIAISVVTITVDHVVAGNPIWWKNDRLYSVTMDDWPASMNASSGIPRVDLGPTALTYIDATRLFESTAPVRKVIMFALPGVLSGGLAQKTPLRSATRVTTADFFGMFDVPFLYGGAWSAEADRRPDPVLILSREENDKLFGGVNSVGRTIRWNDHEFRVVGVLDDWFPQPKYFALDEDSTDSPPEDVYLPWGWGVTLELPASSMACFTAEPMSTFKDMLGAECVWIEMWVELSNAANRQRMQGFMDNYWADQHRAGRFPRPRNNRLTDVGQWIKDRDFSAGDDPLLITVGFAAFAVCLVNVLGLILAKFLGRAPISGVRRALGASQRQIILQHLVEGGLLAGLGTVAGLVLAELSLWGIYHWMAFVRTGGGDYHAHMRFDVLSFAWAAGLAIAATFAAGLYPAWRLGRLPPAAYLKSL